MNKSKCDTRLNGKCLSGIWSGKRINENVCKYCSQNKNRKAGRPSSIIPQILAAKKGDIFPFVEHSVCNNFAMCCKRNGVDAYQETYSGNDKYKYQVVIGRKPKE